MRNILWICLVTLLTLTACDKEDNVVTIIGEDSATLNAIKTLSKKYEQENNIKIKIVALPFEESLEKSNLDLSNHTALYDIIMQYNFSLSSFVRNDYVYSLDELRQYVDEQDLDFEDDLFKSDWEEVGFYYKDFKNPKSGIKKVGYPFAANTRLLVYNKEWFNNPKYQKAFEEKYGKDLQVPTTWSELMDIAHFFTRPKENMYGICMEGAEGAWLYYLWVDMLNALGGKVMDKERGWEGDINTSLHLNSEQALETMNTMLALKTYNKGTFFDIDMYKQKELMKEGNVAIAIMWSDILYELVDLKHPSEQFGFAEVPGEHSMNAGGAFFINKDSKKSKEAMKFIAWLMRKDNQIEMIKQGLCSPLRSAYDAPSVQNIPYLKALKKSLDRGVYMAEAGPDSDLINQTITKYAQKVWREELAPKDAIEQLQKEVSEKRREIFEHIR